MPRALVTGATGFVGSHLAAYLVTCGWEVDAVARAGSGQLPASVGRREHDGSTQGLIDLVGAAKPDVVFHLASLFIAEHTPEQVAPLIESNVLFGSQLLEAMTRVGCQTLVDAATSWQHFDDAEYDPVCLYAATKQAFSDIAVYYSNAWGLRRVTLELFDTYGPNDTRRKLFTMLAEAAASGDVLAMSAGEQLIDLVHIDDVVRAFEIAAERVTDLSAGASELWSVGARRRLTLRELLSTWQAAGGAVPTISWGARDYRAREVMVPASRTPRLPGWVPDVDLRDGLTRLSSE